MRIEDVTNAAGAVADAALQIAKPIGTVCCLAAICVVAPVVSLIALPFFAFKTAYTAVESNILYNKTLTNHTRAPFGRTDDQNYTRWDGKVVEEAQLTIVEEQLTATGMYLHRCPDSVPSLNDERYNTTFTTQTDAEWLRLEYSRREVEEKLIDEIARVKAVAVGIIPIVGIFYYVRFGLSKFLPGVISALLPVDNPNNSTWDWKAAIHYHETSLQFKLLRA